MFVKQYPVLFHGAQCVEIISLFLKKGAYVYFYY